jgi:hypothetical protein
MEILQCEKNGVQGWKCGENGECYVGLEAKQKAFREQKKIKALEFAENPAELPPRNIVEVEFSNCHNAPIEVYKAAGIKPYKVCSKCREIIADEEELDKGEVEEIEVEEEFCEMRKVKKLVKKNSKD